MKRLVWGIVVAVFGVLFLATAGDQPQGPAIPIALGILCLPGGGALIYLGATYLKARRRAGDLALAMIRETSRIDSAALADTLHTSETRVREMIVDLQRRGTIPKAEFV